MKTMCIVGIVHEGFNPRVYDYYCDQPVAVGSTVVVKNAHGLAIGQVVGFKDESKYVNLNAGVVQVIASSRLEAFGIKLKQYK